MAWREGPGGRLRPLPGRVGSRAGARDLLLGDHLSELPPFVVDGYVADLGWGTWLLGRAQAQLLEDVPDGQLVSDIRDCLQLAATAGALQRIRVEAA